MQTLWVLRCPSGPTSTSMFGSFGFGSDGSSNEPLSLLALQICLILYIAVWVTRMEAHPRYDELML